MNGRIYDPLLGRFLSADVVVHSPGNLQTYNRYSYVANNPLTLTDPSGWDYGDQYGYSGKPFEILTSEKVAANTRATPIVVAMAVATLTGGTTAPAVFGVEGLSARSAVGATIGAATGGVTAAIASHGNLRATLAGAAGGAVAGAIAGPGGAGAGEIIAEHGLTAAAVAKAAVVLASTGAAGGAAGSVTNQVVGNMMNGASMGDAVAKIDGQKVMTSAAVGAIANTVIGGAAASVEGGTARSIAQSTVSVENHVADVANNVHAENVPSAMSGAAADKIVAQAASDISANVGIANRAATAAVTALDTANQATEHATSEAIEEKKKEQDARH
jgi:hypothetical protein